MRMILALLVLVSLAFAQWESTAALAVITSAGFLLVIYMVGMGFGVNELQLMAKEEFYQVLASLGMLAVLIGANGVLNIISAGLAEEGQTNLQDASLTIMASYRTDVSSVVSRISEWDKQAAKEASKSTQCSIVEVGYGISPCGGYAMLAGPLSMGGGIAGFAMGEISAMLRLVKISNAFSLTFLLPLGIILRAFKVTRGAGGFFIALGVSMHIMLPAGILFNEMLSVTFINVAAATYGYTGSASASIPECYDDGDHISMKTGSGSPSEKGKSDERAAYGYQQIRGAIKPELNIVLLKATLGPVIALLMFAASLRAITSLAGAEVDVSAISRFV